MASDQNPDAYYEKHKEWHEVLRPLRKLILSTELQETIKWGRPCYTLDGKNVLGLAAFNEHASLWFFQGGLLKDPENLLINAQEGKTQAMRQIRFDQESIIDTNVILTYINEAINNERKGLKVKMKKKASAKSLQLNQALKASTELSRAFKDLTPGRQKEYHDYINDAKRQETKQSRIKKSLNLISHGLGLNDKYRN